MSATPISKARAAGGRPPKFTEARRPITVTLPERVLSQLARIHPDRALALVKCVEAVAGGTSERALVELVEVLPGKSLIVVGSRRALERIEWLRMVEIAPGRFLLVLPTGMPMERLEVELQDLRETLGADEEAERGMLEQLQRLLIQQRRRNTLSKGELVFVDSKP